MVFDYEADCSYNTKMLLLPYTSNCGECRRAFGRQAVQGGLCVAVTLPFCSSARIGIIPHSPFNQGLSLFFRAPPPWPALSLPSQRRLSLLSKQPPLPLEPRHSGWRQAWARQCQGRLRPAVPSQSQCKRPILNALL